MVRTPLPHCAAFAAKHLSFRRLLNITIRNIISLRKNCFKCGKCGIMRQTCSEGLC